MAARFSAFFCPYTFCGFAAADAASAIIPAETGAPPAGRFGEAEPGGCAAEAVRRTACPAGGLRNPPIRKNRRSGSP